LPANLSQEANALDAIARQAADFDHPLGRFVKDTALSYLNIAQMLEHRGDQRMTQLSVAEYGKPGDRLSGGRGATSLDAANYFLSVSRDYKDDQRFGQVECCLCAQSVKESSDSRLAEVLVDRQIGVKVDATLASKAAAGATGIRLRDATCFSEYDKEQLLQHEAFVHT
jgi:hypothetical protein